MFHSLRASIPVKASGLPSMYLRRFESTAAVTAALRVSPGCSAAISWNIGAASPGGLSHLRGKRWQTTVLNAATV
jgi:hypothetical protein